MGGAAQLGVDSNQLFTNEDLDVGDEKEESDENKPKR